MYRWPYFLQNDVKTPKLVYSSHIFINSLKCKSNSSIDMIDKVSAFKTTSIFDNKKLIHDLGVTVSRSGMKVLPKNSICPRKKSFSVRESVSRTNFESLLRKIFFKGFKMAHQLFFYFYLVRITAKTRETDKLMLQNKLFYRVTPYIP